MGSPFRTAVQGRLTKWQKSMYYSFQISLQKNQMPLSLAVKKITSVILISGTAWLLLLRRPPIFLFSFRMTQSPCTLSEECLHRSDFHRADASFHVVIKDWSSCICPIHSQQQNEWVSKHSLFFFVAL